MKIRHAVPAAVTLLLAACTFTFNESGSPVSSGYPQQAVPSTSQEMLALINQARSVGRKCGDTHYPSAPPLKWNALLEKSARAHAQDMADKNYFKHESLDGRDFSDRIRNTGYRYRAAAENISAGIANAQDAIKGWLKSPGHCKNIMNPDYAEVGMGPGQNSKSHYGVYWVQNFGTTW